MSKLSELTDNYYDPIGNATQPLPVEEPFPGLKKVYITGEEPGPAPESSPLSNNVDKIINSLFRDDDKRLQLWPEKVIRGGLTKAGEVASGMLPQWSIDKDTGEVHTSPQMIEAAQEISALAGTGGLGGTGSGGVALGATPFLRPALKYKDKLYKGKEGQQHLDVIPESMYPDFQKKAMSGEDIKDYNFGFINDKGHFLDRESALKYGIDTGLIDPQAGKFGALTSTLMADSSKPGMAIEAMKKAPAFYSAVEHNLAQIPQAKMTGDQWLGTLSNKPGVKGEEMQWTGLADFFAENKGKPVTKAQIEEHLQNNKVELKEVTKGTGELKAAAEGLQSAVGNDKISVANHRDKLYADEIEQGLWSGDITVKDLPANLQPHAEKMLSFRHQQENPTKYHSYQLPGGENYREMLLTLPEKRFPKDDPRVIAEAKAAYTEKDITRLSDDQWRMLQARAARRNGDKLDEQYRSSHWDEPNILAHVRMNDRTIDGKKSLHLEEIQSDWHQQGRDRGYAGNAKMSEEEITKVAKQTAEGRGISWNSLNEAQRETYARSARRDLEKSAVPDAPFKKSWHELALKRMLREASEKGYDRLSWTPGEAQAERYSLAKQVDKIAVPMVNKDGTRSVRIDSKEGTPFKLMVDKNGKVEGAGASSSQFSGKPLSDVVGKEMADKIMKLENPTDFSGEGLKIGGEGMKGFYDQIIPKALEKLGKEHGVKVKQTNVIAPMKKMGDAGEQPIHYIDIPQSLKDTATQKGFPLFSNGYMLVPVAHNPFEDKK